MRSHGAHGLALLLSGLLGTACGHTGWLRQQEERCTPVWTAIRTDVGHRGAACTEDWECRRVAPAYLGCGAWAAATYELTPTQTLALEEACAPVSFARDCSGTVGACVAGRCTGRPAHRDAAACLVAREALANHLAEPVACQTRRDCSPVSVSGVQGVGRRGWRETMRRSLFPVEDACPDDDELPHGKAETVEDCVEGRCVLRPSEGAKDVRWRDFARPVQVDRNCVGQSVQLPAAVGGTRGSVVVRFKISPRGVPYSFRLDGTDDHRILFAVTEAISKCAFEPARDEDGAIEIWGKMQINFVGR